MIHTLQARELQSRVIAQDDDCDYDESGYIVMQIEDDKFGLAKYSHCSCYDTWDNLGINSPYSDREVNLNDVGWDWTGTKDQLIHLAVNKLDYTVTDREAHKDDYDYDHLMAVYEELRQYFNV